MMKFMVLLGLFGTAIADCGQDSYLVTSGPNKDQCKLCQDGTGNVNVHAASCAEYQASTQNYQYCNSDTIAGSTETVLDFCPMSCDHEECFYANDPFVDEQYILGQCPQGMQIFHTLGSNSVTGSMPGECYDACVPENVPDWRRFINLVVYDDDVQLTQDQLSKKGGLGSCADLNKGYPAQSAYLVRAVLKQDLSLYFDINAANPVLLRRPVYNANVYIRRPVTSSPTSSPTEVPEDTFDFGSGCGGGQGEFRRTLPKKDDVIDVGIIPAGKFNVRVNLVGLDGDTDIQLFDLSKPCCNVDSDTGSEIPGEDWPEGGAAIIAWCENGLGYCNYGLNNLVVPGGNGAKLTAIWPTANGDMEIEYSGYWPDTSKPNRGDEYITIKETKVDLLMRAYAYTPGLADVKYFWGPSQSQCCLGQAQCSGTFSKALIKDESVFVGNIPAGVKDLAIMLTGNDGDTDIQIYDTEMNINPVNGKYFEEGVAIFSWCNDSPNCNYAPSFNDDNKQGGDAIVLDDYYGSKMTYTGYWGTINQDGTRNKGEEEITITPYTTRDILMKAYGYEEGTATIDYTYWMEPTVN